MSGSISCHTASGGRTQLSIDSLALVPWRKIADVLGQSLEHYIEQFMRDCGRENEHFLILDEAVNTTQYATREAAQAVAQRYELYMVESRLNGEKSVITVENRFKPRTAPGVSMLITWGNMDGYPNRRANREHGTRGRGRIP